MDYNVKFDNSNVIRIEKNGKTVTCIACPAIEKGCDIINFNDKLSSGYTFNFDVLILITTKQDRSVYYKGDLVDYIKR